MSIKSESLRLLVIDDEQLTAESLTEMLKLYSAGMHSNEPVHTWADLD